ncbi:MAG: hypothetical protein LBC52_07990 [Treponema sp.]|jgi:hypothetical protein|nr:hypothetical protein [Treponema sp.]
MRKRVFICLVLLFFISQLWAQQGVSRNDEIISNIGLRLEDVFLRYGVPNTVQAARGNENWQDDVVFVYSEWDFYIFRDRVWQIGLKSGYGMKIGDPKAVALLVLADKAKAPQPSPKGVEPEVRGSPLDEGDYLLYPLTGSAWPVSLRVNFIADKISGIFVFRTDF